MTPPLSPLAAEVRRYDRDRFVTALFAPADRREALLALYAFNGEIARIRESVSEPLLGEMRLQWWRDALAKIYGGGDLAHPVAMGLAAAIRAHDLSRGLFDRLIDARAADLSDGPPADLAALEVYADGTSATLIGLALETLGARGDSATEVAHDAGIGWALVGLLRAVPFHGRAGRVYLPTDFLARYAVNADDLRTGTSSAGLARVAEELAERAREHLARARSIRARIPRAARAPLLVVPMAEAYLARLRAAGYDLTDTRWSAIRPPVARLTLRAFVAGY